MTASDKVTRLDRHSERVAPDALLELGNGFRSARVLMSAVELGVFSALASGPMVLEPLQRRIGLHPRGARDFLDALSALGLLVRDSEGRYANSPEASEYLAASSPSFIGGWFQHLAAYEYSQWQELTGALRSGEVPTVTGDLYSRLYSTDDQVTAFASAMSGATVLLAKRLAAAFAWQDYQSFVDVGSAEGCLPIEVVRRHPHLNAIGFDLPPLQAAFERNVLKNGLSGQVHFLGGDFLSDSLPQADVLVLGRVLHNWDLEKKKLLLRKAYRSVAPNGAVIIYERFIDDGRSTVSGLLASLNMLVMTSGGFDYSSADCVQWMADIGFVNMVLTPLTADQSMVVGIRPPD